MSIEAMKQALEYIKHIQINVNFIKTSDESDLVNTLERAIEQAEKQTHTDHPMRHWDKTCPACVAEVQP